MQICSACAATLPDEGARHPTFAQRVGAALIDFAVMSAVLTFGVAFGLGTWWALVALAYVPLVEGLFEGQTLGKQCLGLRFVHLADGERPTVPDAATEAAADPSEAFPASDAIAAAWFADPLAQHELRWWDGSQWTEHVADGGTVSHSALPNTVSV